MPCLRSRVVAPWIESDELWELVEPLLPKVQRRSRYPGKRTCRLLLVRYDRRADIHRAFLGLACCLLCWRGCSR